MHLITLSLKLLSAFGWFIFGFYSKIFFSLKMIFKIIILLNFIRLSTMLQGTENNVRYIPHTIRYIPHT